MSQTKVEQNKEQKKNRKKTVAKQKIQTRIADITWAVCMCVIVVWVGFSIYNKLDAKNEEARRAISTPVATDAISDYIGSLSEDGE